MTEDNGDSRNTASKKVTLLTIMGSVFSGWLGVQSKKNRERDFEHGKFSHFIIGGAIFLLVFVLSVIGVVQLVLSTAGN
jgi:hypothetical protein